MSEKTKPFVILSAILAVTLLVVGVAYSWLEGYAAERAVAQAEAARAQQTASDAEEALAAAAAEEPPAPSWPGTEGADDAQVQAMEVRTPSAELLDASGYSLGTPSASVQVKAGQGLRAGSTWWVVLLDSPSGDGGESVRRAFLTNAPGESGDGTSGTWIELPLDDPWSAVDWEGDTLVRGQSALKRAYLTLEGA